MTTKIVQDFAAELATATVKVMLKNGGLEDKYMPDIAEALGAMWGGMEQVYGEPEDENDLAELRRRFEAGREAGRTTGGD